MSARPDSPASASPFSPRTVLGLVVIGGLAFLAFLWLVGAGLTGGNANNGQATVGGKGLNGYAAMADYLERRGYAVSRVQSLASLKQPGLLILTPRIVWATTTPVHPDRPWDPSQKWRWHNAEIKAYNRPARELMESRKIPVNDLHRLIWSDLETYLSPDKLHHSEAGQRACARAVVQALETHLGKS